MTVTNETLFYLNRFNFNELSERKYTPLDEKETPFLWTYGNNIILPRPQKTIMDPLEVSPKEDFFPTSVEEINASLQKRVFTNYFTSLGGKEDILWRFSGFLGFRFDGKPEYYSFFMNSPQIIENFTLSSSLGVKRISRPEKRIFLFETDETPSVPEVDSKLTSIEKHVLGLKSFMGLEIYRKITDRRSTISRYHPMEQQLLAMEFINKLNPVSAEETLEAYNGKFFMNYVNSVR